MPSSREHAPLPPFSSHQEEEAAWHEWAGCYVALRDISSEVNEYLEMCEEMGEVPSRRHLQEWASLRVIFEVRFQAVDALIPPVTRHKWLEQVL